MTATISAGQTVTYTNRKGDVFTATVVEILSAEVFGTPRAVVEFLDGPLKGGQKRFKLDELTVKA